MLLPSNDNYNYHSHTQFCDGRASMEVMAAAAFGEGMEIWGFSPHSPICVPSPCNMTLEQVPEYLDEASRLRDCYAGRMTILTGMEVDFMSRDFGPHIDLFQKMPLDYRIGSVHFVPNQDGIPVDCDGNAERFKRYLAECYRGDLRYVVERYFEQVLTMIELGGFEILGHFDKIAANASSVDPDIEEAGWYDALIDDVIRMACDRDYIIEINTKSLKDRGRFFPSLQHWKRIQNTRILVNSDAHHPDLVNANRNEALRLLRDLQA